MRATSGPFCGHAKLLEAASRGAVPSDGPASTSLRSGNPEYVNSLEYELEQREIPPGRFTGKINSLNRQREVLVYRGQFAQADVLDAERAHFQ